MNIEEVYRRVATKHEVSEDTVKQIHLDFWKGAKKIMQGDTAKDILVNGFCSFSFDKRNLYAASSNIDRRMAYNEKFLKNGGDWLRYLYIYRGHAYRKKQIDNLWNSI